MTTRTLCIHWPRGRMTEQRAAALADVLEQHGGTDRVRVVGGHDRLDLGITVDACSVHLARAVHEATEGATSHVIDPATVWPDDLSTLTASEL